MDPKGSYNLAAEVVAPSRQSEAPATKATGLAHEAMGPPTYPCSAAEWHAVLLKALGSQEDVDACLAACSTTAATTTPGGLPGAPEAHGAHVAHGAPEAHVAHAAHGAHGSTEAQGAQGAHGAHGATEASEAPGAPGAHGAHGATEAQGTHGAHGAREVANEAAAIHVVMDKDRSGGASPQETLPTPPAQSSGTQTPWFFWQVGERKSLQDCFSSYLGKMSGGRDKALPVPVPLVNLLWSGVGCFLGILLLAGLADVLADSNFDLLLGSFGASAVLVFIIPDAKLSQPRNLVGGQGISALIGVLVKLAFQNAYSVRWVAAAVGMALAGLAMLATGTTHPPAGATAMVVCWQEELPPWEGFQYVVGALFGSTLLMLVGLLVNNLAAKRHYPTFWF